MSKTASNVWTVFEGRLIGAIFQQHEPVSYEELAAKLHLNSPTQAANLLVTGKRMYVRLLRQAVGEYEPADSGIGEEIAALQHTLSNA